jgi:hypothetical protein
MLEKSHSPSPPSESPHSVVAKECDDVPGVYEDLERKAVRRIDYNILPVVSMFMLLSQLVSAHGNPFDFEVKPISFRIEQISVNLLLH